MKAQRSNALAQLVTNLQAVDRRCAGQNQHELFAAITGHEVGLTDLAIELFGNDAQHLVTRAVPIGIVNLLKEVDVPDGDAGGLSEALPALKLFNHALVAGVTIRNLRQAINH